MYCQFSETEENDILSSSPKRKWKNCICPRYGVFCFVTSNFANTSDVPKNSSDLMISILVYSKASDAEFSGPGGMSASPSMQSLTSINFFSSAIKRTGTITSSRQALSNFDRNRIPAAARDIGMFLGELTIAVPSGHAFAKVHSWHPINSSKKTLGRIRLEMGLFTDIDFTPVPDVPDEYIENFDSINFYLLTQGGLV